MDCEFLVVSSITYALKGKSILEGKGIACKVEKIKKVSAFKSCGYGIKVNKKDSVTAARFLMISGIKVIETVDCGANKR